MRKKAPRCILWVKRGALEVFVLLGRVSAGRSPQRHRGIFDIIIPSRSAFRSLCDMKMTYIHYAVTAFVTVYPARS
ncbi:MAG TPA: hypothetical protein VLB04_07550, partial [Methanotrichaceae archaeon]|nr:hypothetical protein [Methanotrichaceae archaeon]